MTFLNNWNKNALIKYPQIEYHLSEKIYWNAARKFVKLSKSGHPILGITIGISYINPTSRTRTKYPTSLSVPFLNIFDPVDINFWNSQIILISWRWFLWHFQIFSIVTNYRDNERKRTSVRTSVKHKCTFFLSENVKFERSILENLQIRISIAKKQY